MALTEEDRNAATRVAIQAAREDLLSFIMLIDPTFSVGPHHRHLCDVLMDVEAGRKKRAMVFVPPRSSKSTISSIYFPAWCLGRHPNWQMIEVSHSSDLAKDFGRAVRDVIYSKDYKIIFPDTEIRTDQKAASDWATTKKGKFLAAGAGTGIAGKGAHLGIIDDPISEQDAWSKSKRETVNNWYPGGFRTRLMPGGRVVIVQTRWTEDDLSGDLLRKMDESEYADQWEVVKFPALNTPESAVALETAREELIDQGILHNSYPKIEVGKSFWPDSASGKDDEYHWPTKEMLATKHNLPPFQWDALYMQNPTPAEGGIIKTAYWQDWAGQKPPPCQHKILSLDCAFGKDNTGDYSAYTLWGLFTHSKMDTTYSMLRDMPCMILLGAGRGHWTYPQLREKVVEKYDRHRPDTVLIEDKASGQSLIQELSFAGLPIRKYNPDKDKVARAYSCSSIFHNKRIFAPTNREWAQTVIDEARTFPNGAHDDFMDTVTQAILWVVNGGFLIHSDDPWNTIDDSAIIKGRQHGGFY